MQSRQQQFPGKTARMAFGRCSGTMRAVTLKLLTAGCLAGLVLMTERPAHAYVDPGSGLLTLQVLGASIAGTFFLLRQKIRRLLSGHVTSLNQDASAQPSKNDAPLAKNAGH